MPSLDELFPESTTNTSPDDYYATLAQKAASIAGVPADWVLAQWKHETGNFTSPLTRENNFGGLTQETPNDMPQPDGSLYYRRFKTPEDYAEYFGKYLKLYKEDGLDSAKTPEDYARVLKRGGYYGDSEENYIARLKDWGAKSTKDSSNVIDDLFFSKASASPAQPSANSLDALFAEAPSTPQQTSTPSTGKSLDELFGDKPQGFTPDPIWGKLKVSQQDIDSLPIEMQVGVGSDKLEKPQTPATELALQYAVNPLKAVGVAADYLMKPQGAVAGVINNLAGYGKPNETITEAAKRGWEDNASNIDTMRKYAPNDPIGSSVLGLAMDVVFDPLNLTPLAPAKLVALGGTVLSKLNLLDKAANIEKIATSAEKATQIADKGVEAVRTGSKYDWSVPIIEGFKDDLQAAVKTGDANKVQQKLVEMDTAMKDMGVSDGIKAVVNPEDMKFTGPLADAGNAIANSPLGKGVSAVANVNVAGLPLQDWFKLAPDAMRDIMDARSTGIATDTIENKKLMNSIAEAKKNIYERAISEGLDKTAATAKMDEFSKFITQYVTSPHDALVDATNQSKGIIRETKKDILKQASEDYQYTPEERSIIATARSSGKELPDIQAQLAKDLAMDSVHFEKDAPNILELQKKLDSVTSLIDKQYNRQASAELAKQVKDKMQKQFQAELPQKAAEARPVILEQAKAAGFNNEQAGKISELGDKVADMQKRYTETMYKMRLITKEEYELYANGSHLRRDYSKYVSPEAFLELLKKSDASEADINAAKRIVIQKQTTPEKYRISANMKLDDLLQRVNLPESVRAKMGQICDAEYLVGRTGQINSDLIHTNTALAEYANKFAKSEKDIPVSEITAKKWRIIPDIPEWGDLAGKYVPANVYFGLIHEANNPSAYQKAIGAWKAGKTILNPATHVRNGLSNMILLDIAGIPTIKVPYLLARSVKEIASEGKYWKEAEPYLTGGFAKSELQGIVNGKTTLDAGKVQQGLEKVKNAAGKFVETAGDIYQKNEQAGKLAAFIWKREKGASVQEAAKFAQDTLFNYSQVPPIVDVLRRTGVIPFVSFPYFAGKATAKALYERPASVTKYYKLKSLGDQDEQALFPEFMQPYNFLPIGKGMREVNGEQQPVSRYIDMSYINPFESDFNITPLISIAATLATGIDPFTKQKIEASPSTDDQLKAKAMYLAKAIGPAAVGNVDKIVDALQGNMDSKGRVYKPWEAISTALGIKISPINVEESARNNLLKFKYLIDDTRKAIYKTQNDQHLSEKEKEERTDKLTKDIDRYRDNIEYINNVYDKVLKKTPPK